MNNNKKILIQIAFIVSIGIFAGLLWKTMYPLLFSDRLFVFFAAKDGTQSDAYIVLFYDLIMTALCILFTRIFVKYTGKMDVLSISFKATVYADEKFSAFFLGSLIAYRLFISIFCEVNLFLKILNNTGAYMVSNAALPVIFIACYRYFLKREPKVFQPSRSFAYRMIPVLQVGYCIIFSVIAIIQVVNPTPNKEIYILENIICKYISVPLEFLTEWIINPKLFGAISVRFFCGMIMPYCFVTFFSLRFFRALERRNIALKSVEPINR